MLRPARQRERQRVFGISVLPVDDPIPRIPVAMCGATKCGTYLCEFVRVLLDAVAKCCHLLSMNSGELRTTNIHIRVAPSDKAKLRELARLDGIDPSSVVRQLVSRAHAERVAKATSQV